jgi:3-isopropylmalate/(R)-2-methylmalate dehydratase large subunit
MAIEAGAKNGIIIPDKVTEEYVKNRTLRPYKFYTSDPDAEYARIIEYNVEEIEPTVAFPHLPENTKPISKVGNVKIDQAVIGSCTNGRISDLQTTAEILKGKKVHRDVRLIVFRDTQGFIWKKKTWLWSGNSRSWRCCFTHNMRGHVLEVMTEFWQQVKGIFLHK